jgi:hypothetical protein
MDSILHFLLLMEGLKLCAGLVRVDPDVLCIDNGKQRFAKAPANYPRRTFANAFENWESLEELLDDVTEKYIEHLGEEACTFWNTLEERGIFENLPCWAEYYGEWWPAKLINHFDPSVMNSTHWSEWVRKKESLGPVQQLKESDDVCLVTYYDKSSNAGVVKIDKIQAFSIKKLDTFVKSLPKKLQDKISFKDAVDKAKKDARELAGGEDYWFQECSSCCKVRRRLGVKEETGAFTCSNAKWVCGTYRYRACCVPERQIDRSEWKRDQSLERKGKRSSETPGRTLAQFQEQHKTTKVYRVLDDMDLENLQKGEGLKSRAVHNGRERDENYNLIKNITNHVKDGCKNADDSFLISSSLSKKWILWYAHKKFHLRNLHALEYTQSETIKSGIYPFVEIDLSKVDNVKIFDVSHKTNNDTQCILRSEPGFENIGAKFAQCAEEVLIQGSIPREAIKKWFEFNQNGTCFKKMPTATQRTPTTFESYDDWESAVRKHPTYRKQEAIEELIKECKDWAEKIEHESRKPKPASKYTETALFKVFKGPEQSLSSKGDGQSPSGVRKRKSEDATVPAKKHKVSKKKVSDYDNGLLFFPYL